MHAADISVHEIRNTTCIPD